MLALCCAVVLAVFAFVQTASLAVFSHAAAADSLPAHLPPQLGERMYATIARIAPSPYVIDMLIRAAYDRGDLQAARMRAMQLPKSAARAEWIGRIADASGDEPAALDAFLRAADADAVQARIDALARHDIAAAIVLERRLIVRMALYRDHPDAVADAMWHLGVQLAQTNDRTGALGAFKGATSLAPLNVKYLLSLASEEDALGMHAAARADRERAHDVDPRLAP